MRHIFLPFFTLLVFMSLIGKAHAMRPEDSGWRIHKEFFQITEEEKKHLLSGGVTPFRLPQGDEEEFRDKIKAGYLEYQDKKAKGKQTGIYQDRLLTAMSTPEIQLDLYSDLLLAVLKIASNPCLRYTPDEQLEGRFRNTFPLRQEDTNIKTTYIRFLKLTEKESYLFGIMERFFKFLFVNEDVLAYLGIGNIADVDHKDKLRHLFKERKWVHNVFAGSKGDSHCEAFNLIKDAIISCQIELDACKGWIDPRQI